MGSDDITPDKKTDEPKATHYSLTWFTNGYRPTKKGVRERRKARERERESKCNPLTFICVLFFSRLETIFVLPSNLPKES